MKKSVQIFLELISAIALYLFINSIAYGDHLVTLPLYLTGVVIMSYLFVRERPQECLQSALRIVLPFTGLMLIAGSLPDAHFSLALIYIVSTGAAFFIRNAHCHREQDVPEDRLIGIDFSAGSCRTVVVFSGVSIFDRRTLVYLRKLII